MFEKITTRDVTGPHLFFWGSCEMDDLITEAWEHRCAKRGRQHVGNVRIIVRTDDPKAFQRVDAEARRRAIDNGRPQALKVQTQFVGDVSGFAELIKALNDYAKHLGRKKNRAISAQYVARQLAQLAFEIHLCGLEDKPSRH